MNRVRASKANTTKWYNDASVILNRTLPTFYHDYVNQRYFDTNIGETAFPFTGTRTTNAMMYDRQGRLVWGPANMSTSSGAYVAFGGSDVASAVIGSDGVAFRTYTADGLNSAHFHANTNPFTTIVGYTYTISTYITSTSNDFVQMFPSGAMNGTAYANFQLSTMSAAALGGAIDAKITAAGALGYRISMTYAATGTGGGAAVVVGYSTSLAASRGLSAAVTWSCTIGMTQIEYTDINSPNVFNSTTASAYYGPRFDTQPVDMKNIGVLVEIGGANLCLNSHNYSTGWTLTNCSLSTLTTDPMGFTTGQTVLDGAVAATALKSGLVTTAAATIHTASIHLKRGNTDWVRIQVLDTTGLIGFQCWVNLNTKTAGSANLIGTGTYFAGSLQISPINNGWIRVAFSGTVGAATTMSISTMTASANLSTTNVSGGTYQVWGHQLETYAGYNSNTSYIPTFSASATRVGDSLNQTLTGWFNATKGTFVASMLRPYDAASYSAQPFTISDGGLNNRIQVHGSNSIGIVQRSAGVNYDYSGATGLAAYGDIENMAIKYSTIGARYVGQGGVVVVSGTAVAPVSPNIMRIGGNFSGPTGKSWVTQVRFYPDDTSTDAQLQDATV